MNYNCLTYHVVIVNIANIIFTVLTNILASYEIYLMYPLTRL
jgi:hypothetical protein